MQKAYGVNSYTEEGRELVHKKLEGVDMAVLHNLMRNPIDGESIEFNCSAWRGCAYYLFPAEWCDFAGYSFFD